ncbi:helix-turn-helix domain-containing protein [Candidatus Clavichlamydia salmonicola]|uniref:helix-turn-helix domain-containing protein n=1 Tax=Candidatus Clavichlamydia salmonicola TaxID=469812 RepID=UPI0018912EDF|nr:helix-turn-helix domain-containing protein [Candidatus Clavichlamydia salmonicola]
MDKKVHKEVLQLGGSLKKVREEKGLSIKEVESVTSIRASYLHAIEEGKLGKLISPVYAEGFIKQYAIFLDIDGDQLINDHPEVLKFLRETALEQEDYSLGFTSLEIRSSPAGEVKWFPNFLRILSILVGIGLLWFIISHLGWW